jgi:16S rRNA (adenine1518-N6/adenine1519-N6)-dimethyltransferase
VFVPSSFAAAHSPGPSYYSRRGELVPEPACADRLDCVTSKIQPLAACALVATHRPKLGQHFLTSAVFRHHIADALPVRKDDLVIEIGAGRGAMTGLVAERAARVVAVELDSRLAEQFRKEFAGRERIEILQADILKLDLAELCRSHGVEKAFVFGNLPYYITSPILHHLLESAPRIRAMAFVVQREVALRITAGPCSRAYGYLSVLAQCYSRPRIAFSIPPGAFSPPPAVHSALITFEMFGEMMGEMPIGTADRAGASENQNELRRRKFLDFVKLSFARKRKKLTNNLSVTYPADTVRDALRSLGLGDSVRAEELPVADLWRVYEALNRPR